MKKIVLAIIFTCLIGIAGCGIGMVVLNNDNKSLNSGNSENLNNNTNGIKDNNKNNTSKDNFKGNGIKSWKNSRIAYKYEDDVYYKNYVGDNSIVKLNSNGKKEQITTYTPEIEFIHNGFLYASSTYHSTKTIYTFKKDTFNEELNKTIDSANLGIGLYNNDIYYNNYDLDVGSNLYRFNNGTYRKLKENIGEFFIYNNKVYYNKLSSNIDTSNAFSIMYQNGLYEADLDFSNEKLVYDGDVLSNIAVHKDFIFFYENNKLCRINLDGTNLVIISNEEIADYQLTDNNIYLTMGIGNELYKMDLDGKNSKVLLDERVMYFDVVDDYIYFVSRSTDNNIGRMKNDGTKIENMNVSF